MQTPDPDFRYLSNRRAAFVTAAPVLMGARGGQ